VGDQDVVPAPLTSGSSTVLVSPNGAAAALLSRTGDRGWALSALPAGRPVAAALVGDRLYVATRPKAGAAATLYQARWPS
jgi:hypothetical protein